MLAIGAASIALGAQRYPDDGEDWPAIALIATGFTLAPFGLVFAVTAAFQARGQALLLAGVRRLAQWQLTAAQWDAFRAFDGNRHAEDFDRLANDMRIRKRTPSGGVDVIVGERSLLIDGSYHPLRPRGLPELRAIGWLDNAARAGRPPDCLEFELAYPRGRYGGVQLTTLRVPFPREARADALRVYQFFAPKLVRRPPIALRNPRRTLRVTAALLAICVIALVAGWAMAQANGWSTDETVLPLVLMIAGAVGAVFALVLGALTLLLAPRRG
jgi:hypothetical protein